MSGRTTDNYRAYYLNDNRALAPHLSICSAVRRKWLKTKASKDTRWFFCASLTTRMTNGGQCLAWYCLLFFNRRSRVAVIKLRKETATGEASSNPFRFLDRENCVTVELRACVKTSDWTASKCKSTSSEHEVRVCCLATSGRTTNNMNVWNESRACCTVGRLLTHARTVARSHRTSLWVCWGWRKTVSHIISPSGKKKKKNTLSPERCRTPKWIMRGFFPSFNPVSSKLWPVHFCSSIFMYMQKCSR